MTKCLSHIVGMFLFVSLCSVSASGVEVEDKRITDSLAGIERASERGDYRTLRESRSELADYAKSVGRYDLAARQYELLLAARPRRVDRVRYSIRLGDMRMALKDYVRAINAYDDALHDNAKDWDANLGRARAFAAADIDQRAIESYKRCIALRPSEAVSYEELAGVYEKQGFLGKAISYYEQALARDPKPIIYLRMADCYVHQKNLTMAITILTHAKERLPRVDYDVRLGEIYQTLGDSTRAILAWEEALKSDAARDDVRLRLALLYDQAKRTADADRLFRHLMATYPQSPLVHYMKALLLFERGDKEAARAEALRVQQLSPTELVGHFNDLLLLEIRKRS